MLEQAGLANVVSSFQTDEVGAVRVFLASWPAAMHCFMAAKEGLGTGSAFLNFGTFPLYSLYLIFASRTVGAQRPASSFVLRAASLQS